MAEAVSINPLVNLSLKIPIRFYVYIGREDEVMTTDCDVNYKEEDALKALNEMVKELESSKRRLYMLCSTPTPHSLHG